MIANPSETAGGPEPQARIVTGGGDRTEPVLGGMYRRLRRVHLPGVLADEFRLPSTVGTDMPTPEARAKNLADLYDLAPLD